MVVGGIRCFGPLSNTLGTVPRCCQPAQTRWRAVDPGIPPGIPGPKITATTGLSPLALSIKLETPSVVSRLVLYHRVPGHWRSGALVGLTELLTFQHWTKSRFGVGLVSASAMKN